MFSAFFARLTLPQTSHVLCVRVLLLNRTILGTPEVNQLSFIFLIFLLDSIFSDDMKEEGQVFCSVLFRRSPDPTA